LVQIFKVGSKLKKKKIILDFIKLEKIIKTIRAKNKKIVLCHGVFDLFHFGHLEYFSSAKKYGDILIASITEDKFINKGPGRPVFKSFERLKILEALEIVDYVVISRSVTSEKLIKLIKPDIYAKGPDYKNHKNDVTSNILKEVKLVKRYGGKTIYTNEETKSSSEIINKNHIGNFDPKVISLKKEIRKKLNYKKLILDIEKFKKLKVLVIGETIIDNYIFCEAIGKSGKEPHLVLKDQYSEEYMGGVIAIAKHLETFCKKVTIATALGENHKFYYSKILKHLNKNVHFKYFEKQGAPTILKKRYIDYLTKNKLLGIYSFNDRDLSKVEIKKYQKLIFNQIKNYDLILISDYGHGIINNKLANKLCNAASNKIFLNAQLNAANFGHHTLLKYKKFNSLIINESELRHEMRDRYSKIENLIKTFSRKINLATLLLTRGTQGSILYKKKLNRFYYCPALANNVVDKVGGGDAMLSLAALSLKLKLDPLAVLLTSSIAASVVVESIGNSKSVKKKDLLKSLQYFCK
tara:strand:+ start:4289 stop:5857 length:1569 start_codon:yes stop_codon:yes gene_type:complete